MAATESRYARIKKTDHGKALAWPYNRGDVPSFGIRMVGGAEDSNKRPGAILPRPRDRPPASSRESGRQRPLVWQSHRRRNHTNATRARMGRGSIQSLDECCCGGIDSRNLGNSDLHEFRMSHGIKGKLRKQKSSGAEAQNLKPRQQVAQVARMSQNCRASTAINAARLITWYVRVREGLSPAMARERRSSSCSMEHLGRGNDSPRPIRDLAQMDNPTLQLESDHPLGALGVGDGIGPERE